VKKLLLLLLALVLVLAGVAYLISDFSGTASAAGVKFDTELPVLFGTLHETVAGTGEVKPRSVLVVSTESSGRVVKLLHDYNDVVESGDELLQLDDWLPQQKLAQARAAVASAEAAAETAQADLSRATFTRQAAESAYEPLRTATRGTYPQTELDAAFARVQAARAGVQTAEAAIKTARAKVQEAKEVVAQAEHAVEMTHVRVPFVEHLSAATGKDQAGGLGTITTANGGAKRKYVILERKVSLNQLVAPPLSSQLFTLAEDLERMEVQVQIAESDASKVGRGCKAYFNVSAYPEKESFFTGEVSETRLLPTSVQGAVFYTAILSAHNQKDERGEWRLRPGMTTTTLEIVQRTHDGPEHKGVWLVPTPALDFQLDEAYQPAAFKKNPPTPRENERLIWLLDETNQPKPVIVKVGAAGKVEDGQTGLKAEPFTQVVWPAELKPQPVPGKPDTYPRVITGAPPAKKGFNPVSVIKF
jgi:multidrug efflux pump subunit AcrA (membrane-fusion protein)